MRRHPTAAAQPGGVKGQPVSGKASIAYAYSGLRSDDGALEAFKSLREEWLKAVAEANNAPLSEAHWSMFSGRPKTCPDDLGPVALPDKARSAKSCARPAFLPRGGPGGRHVLPERLPSEGRASSGRKQPTLSLRSGCAGLPILEAPYSGFYCWRSERHAHQSGHHAKFETDAAFSTDDISIASLKAREKSKFKYHANQPERVFIFDIEPLAPAFLGELDP